MICPNCGEAIDHMAEYCKYCGKATNAAARYNYRPPVVPIRKTEPRTENPPGGIDTSLRDALDRLTAHVQKLPTQKQMKAMMFRYAVILAIFTLLCTALCSIGIAKNRAEIAKLETMSSLMTANQDEANDKESAALTPATTAESIPAKAAESTPATTAVNAIIHFDLNIPKDADVSKFTTTPSDINSSNEKDIPLPLLKDTETFRFLGWNTQQDGEGKTFTTSFTLNPDQSGDITLYAQWEKIEKN